MVSRQPPRVVVGRRRDAGQEGVDEALHEFDRVAQEQLVLPRPLLDATPQVLDLETASAGLAFMRRLVSLAEQCGDVLTFEDDEVEARVVRAGRVPSDL